MKIQIIRKKKDPIPKPPPGFGDALRARVKSENYEKRIDALSMLRGGFKLNKSGEVVEEGPTAYVQAELQFTQGHGELAEIYRIGPTAHKAWREMLWLWLDAFERRPLSAYTKYLGQLMYEMAADFYCRSLGLRHTDINTVNVPPEWTLGILGSRMMGYGGLAHDELPALSPPPVRQEVEK